MAKTLKVVSKGGVTVEVTDAGSHFLVKIPKLDVPRPSEKGNLTLASSNGFAYSEPIEGGEYAGWSIAFNGFVMMQKPSGGKKTLPKGMRVNKDGTITLDPEAFMRMQVAKVKPPDEGDAEETPKPNGKGLKAAIASMF